MSEIRFKPPDADAEGFLLRCRKAMVFRKALKDGGGEVTVELLDQMVDFLATWVTEPGDPEGKRDALLMASENQYFQLLDMVSGNGSKKSSPAAKSRRSASTPKGSR